MDASDVGEGTTVYLPIFHDGALFYFGDAHALQGDGEIVGSGLETTMDVTFQFDLIKGRRIRWPRFEDATHIMVAGSVRPLVDAFRIAQVELIEWLVDEYGFDKLDAYQVVSQGGVTRVANVVDPNYTVVAKFPKSALPPRIAAPDLGRSTPNSPVGCGLEFRPEIGTRVRRRSCPGWTVPSTADVGCRKVLRVHFLLEVGPHVAPNPGSRSRWLSRVTGCGAEQHRRSANVPDESDPRASRSR